MIKTQLLVQAMSLPAPRARRTDPVTSHVAAMKAQAFATSQAGRILAALRLHGPRSASELQQIVGLDVAQIDRRMPELRAKGYVQLADQAPRGHCRVWEAVSR